MENEPVNRRTVRQRDVAEALGVSVSTVSRGLHDDPSIPAARRRQIQETAAEMGYECNPMAVSLAHLRHSAGELPAKGCMAWLNLWPSPENLFKWKEFQHYHGGAREEARINGYRLEEFAPAAGMTMRRLQVVLKARGIQGILIAPTQGEYMPPDWDDFDWGSFCVVRFGHSIKYPAFHLVSSDQVTDGIMGYNEIHRMGYRRIGLVRTADAQTRFVAGAAFQQRRHTEGSACPELALPLQDVDQDKDRLRQWIKEHRLEAVFSGVPNMRALLGEAGYRVPEDVGLAAFSVLDCDTDTGIHQNSLEIGQAAVQLLISLIHHGQRGIPDTCRELLIEGRWEQGATLPPLRKAARRR